MNNGHQAPPIVNNGVMFVATPYNQVIALTRETGRTVALPQPEPAGGASVEAGEQGRRAVREQGVRRAGRSGARGDRCEDRKGSLANAGRGQQEGLLHDRGATRRQRQGGRRDSGGDGPIRGFVAAYDPETGEQVWKCFTIPARGEPGSETWPKGDEWKTGGGATWVTGNYDPATNLVFWGVGNGNPWVASER